MQPPRAGPSAAPVAVHKNTNLVSHFSGKDHLSQVSPSDPVLGHRVDDPQVFGLYRLRVGNLVEGVEPMVGVLCQPFQQPRDSLGADVDDSLVGWGSDHLEIWPETPFSSSRYFLDVDYRCNDGFLKRIAHTITPYTTVIRLLGVVHPPANGFPARPLGDVYALGRCSSHSSANRSNSVLSMGKPVLISVIAPAAVGT